MSLVHIKSAIAKSVPLTITFLRQSSIPPVGYRTSHVLLLLLRCCSLRRYTWKSGLAVVDFDWRHLIAKLLTHTSVRCKDLGDICCTSGGIALFVLNFVAMATRVSRGKIQLAAFDGPFPKTPPPMKKNRRYLSHKPSYSQFCPEFCCHGNGGWSGENAIGSIRWPINENLRIGAKISIKFLAQAEL